MVAKGVGQCETNTAMIGGSVLGDSQKFSTGKAELTCDADGLIAERRVGVFCEGFEDGRRDMTHSFECPKGGTAARDGGFGIDSDF